MKAWKEGKKGENSLALEHRKKKRWSKVSVVAVDRFYIALVSALEHSLRSHLILHE